MTVRELQEVFISSCKIVELQEIGEIDIMVKLIELHSSKIKIQDINKEKLPFDEREIIKEITQEFSKEPKKKKK